MLGDQGSRHLHLLPGRPSGSGAAAAVPHRACLGGSAPNNVWFWELWLERLGAVASPEPGLFLLLPIGSV